VLKTSNGLLIFTAWDGFSLVDPRQFKVSDYQVSAIITKMEVNNKEVQITGNSSASASFVLPKAILFIHDVVMDYTQNDFAFEFSAMQMTDPKKNRYRYKLEGYDGDWIETDWTNRRARYTNLNAGTYTFRVKASNHQGIWSDQETTLVVRIFPPPWKTTWAYLGYGILILGILYAGMRNAVRREQLKAGFKLKELELRKAKEVDQVKSQLFANISHEFRTPLTLIKGPVQALLEQATEKMNRDQLLTIQRNADLLLKLVNQLLELARLESGTVIERKSEGDLNTFITIVASSFNSMAEQKQIHYIVEPPAVAVRAFFDKDKIETILINLINNAIKFTPANGRVSVKAVLTPQAANDSLLTITIADTGVGIPAEKQRKVFERFYQVSDAHKESGTGIGLSLVKELVQILNGKIELQSTLGVGSTFSVMLPVTLAGEAQQTIAYTESENTEELLPIEFADEDHAGATGKAVVLVVEDHTDLRQFIIASLGDEYRFIEADNGKVGLEKARQELPDLIISDVMMPDMDGIKMTRHIRNDLRTSHIPVILLTAKATDEAKLSGLSIGADDYLTKPFDKHELVLKVRNNAARQKALREQARIALLSQSPTIEVASADEVFLQKVKTIILNHLANEKLSVDVVAKEIGLSRSQLFRKMTALTGSSINELIRSFRLQKAAQLLEQKWGPVSQVAYEVGFSNLSYFTKCFKEVYGVLPSEYPKK
jgi:signal transduction histidine kinase/DNA-binding response OmpR family regulator